MCSFAVNINQAAVGAYETGSIRVCLTPEAQMDQGETPAARCATIPVQDLVRHCWPTDCLAAAVFSVADAQIDCNLRI